MKRFVQDDVVYSTMLGMDPLHVDQGGLRSFDMEGECKQITQPTLLLSGELEERVNVLPFFNRIPEVRWREFSGSSHATFTDQPEKFRQMVWEFLKS